MTKSQMGRRGGNVAYPNKTRRSSSIWQKPLYAKLQKAAKASDHSINDVVHLVCHTPLTVDDVIVKGDDAFDGLE